MQPNLDYIGYLWYDRLRQVSDVDILVATGGREASLNETRISGQPLDHPDADAIIFVLKASAGQEILLPTGLAFETCDPAWPDETGIPGGRRPAGHHHRGLRARPLARAAGKEAVIRIRRDWNSQPEVIFED